MKHKPQLLRSRRGKVVFLIGVQLLVSLSLVAISAFLFFFTSIAFMGEGYVVLALILSGPINLVTATGFPIFAAISTILAVGLAGLAIRWSSYNLTAWFLAVWCISGASALLFAT